MQCTYCSKQVYVTHICPHCNEYYCLEHREPNTHNCSSHKQLRESITKPQTLKPQPAPKEIVEKPAARLIASDGIQKKLFAASFTIVVVEEILRIVSYARNPPFLAYLDGNFYVKLLYQSISPYIASVIVFLAVCFLLFGTRKLASKSQASTNPYTNLLKKTIPLGIFTAISLVYLFSIANWLVILVT